MSQNHNHLSLATWECKHRVVFTPKYRKKVYSGRAPPGLCIPRACPPCCGIFWSQILDEPLQWKPASS
jgi:hypothetical protein